MMRRTSKPRYSRRLGICNCYEEISIDYSAPSYSAGFYSEEPETKTYVGTDNKLYWNENDKVAVFAGTSENLQYVFTGKTGDCSGTLHKVATEDQTRKATSLSYPSNRTKAYNKILSVQHYTVDIDEAPSIVSVPVEMMTAFKEGNQVEVEPDYLGYGIGLSVE